jgi:NAD(P)-dependent dehydrogenase (short-subunit alcohol dehydrogenase family)
MDGPICVISGVGPGTGSALARRFSDGGYRVALLARNGERLARLESEAARARSYACDVSDPEQVERAAAAIERDLGRPVALIHNAVGGAIGSFRGCRERLAPSPVSHNRRQPQRRDRGPATSCKRVR